jgi:uncharacterized membrane protein YozB (DUF420 family)
MNPTRTLTPDEPRVRVLPKPKRGRYFYSGAAVLFLVFMLLGFQQYYLHGKAFPGRDIAPPLQTLVLLHATAMTAWIVLFLVQPVLIASGSRRAHMAVGRFGAVLAAGIVVLGLMLGIQGTRLTPPEVRVWGVTPKQFMAVPVVSVVIFGLLVAVGVYYRRRPDIHRPMMLMATLIAIPAAVARIGPLNALYENSVLQTIFGPFLWTLVLATLLLVVRWLVTRSFERWFVIGYCCLVASCLLVWRAATTDAWDRFATLLL